MSDSKDNADSTIDQLSLAQGILRLAIISLAYFLAHQLAFLFHDEEHAIMLLWPAGGIGLAALLLNQLRMWPAIVLCLFAVGVLADVFWAGRSLQASAGYMTGNIVESLGCAWLIVRTCGWNVRFTRVKEMLTLIVCVVFVNAGSSCIGAATAALAGSASFWNSWLTWYIGDGLGLLLITPLIVSWSDYRGILSSLRLGLVVELAVFMLVWCEVAWLSFQPSAAPHAFLPHPYMLVALIAWPAFRFGQRGVSVALVAMAIIAITSESVSSGPLIWGGDTSAARLLSLQVFVGFTAFTGLLLAASHAETTSADRAMRQSESLLRSSQAIAHLGSWELDVATKRLSWSDEVYRIFGLRPQEFAATYKAFLEAVHPDDRAQVDAAYTTSISEGKDHYEISHRIIRRDTGEVRYVHEKCEHAKDALGRVIQSVGMVQDITDRKRAEEALRENHELLSLYMRYSPVYTYIKKVTPTESIVLQASENMRQLFGIPSSEAIGKNMAELFPPEFAAKITADDLAVVNKGEVLRLDEDYNGRNYITIKFPIVLDNATLLAGYTIDITEKREAEEELARYRDHLEELVEQRTLALEESFAKLQRAERLASLGTLAAGIAHEINNPLGTMLLSTDLALLSLDNPDKIAELLRRQKADVERCARIVKGVLDFARQRTTNKWALDLNDIVMHSLDFTREYASRHGVSIESRLNDMQCRILGNATELEQVVANLVYNGVQACGRGGCVKIETHSAIDKVKLIVRDNGCGMTPEQISQIFDPFYTTRIDKGGTGLGLSTVHGIVTGHNGTIDISSQPGKGAVFTIEFPCHTEDRGE